MLLEGIKGPPLPRMNLLVDVIDHNSRKQFPAPDFTLPFTKIRRSSCYLVNSREIISAFHLYWLPALCSIHIDMFHEHIKYQIYELLFTTDLISSQQFSNIKFHTV